MAIAKKIDGFISQSSFIRKMFEEGIRLKERYGADNVFDFSLGNPNLDPPEAFKERLVRLAADGTAGKHMYMPNAGYPETRAAVAAAGLSVNAGPVAPAMLTPVGMPRDWCATKAVSASSSSDS